jgi:hypothetical protein
MSRSFKKVCQICATNRRAAISPAAHCRSPWNDDAILAKLLEVARRDINNCLEIHSHRRTPVERRQQA